MVSRETFLFRFVVLRYVLCGRCRLRLVVVVRYMNALSEVGKYIFPPFCNIINTLGGAITRIV